MNKFIVDANNKHSFLDIRDYLCDELSQVVNDKRPIIFICIGTDRSTGDSLGPLIGEKIRFISNTNISVYGNLEHPVHAKNLSETLDEIKNRYSNPFIVAIDACLGNINSVGKIIIDKTPLQPGIALNKDLPPVGDMRILGIVNVAGALEFMVLQNTRLFSVMNIANSISKGINHFILKMYVNNKVSSASDMDSTSNLDINLKNIL